MILIDQIGLTPFSDWMANLITLCLAHEKRLSNGLSNEHVCPCCLIQFNEDLKLYDNDFSYNLIKNYKGIV